MPAKFISKMGLQTIHDRRRNNTGAPNSCKEWNGLKKQHKNFDALEKELSTKEYTISNIKKGLEEVNLFKKGKIKTSSAKDFLNEL